MHLAEAPTTDVVTIDSAVLGNLSVPEASVLTFADGVHGFRGHTRFALVPGARDGLFWLQSLVDASVAFLLVDPFVVTPGYQVDLGKTEKRAIRAESPDDVLLLAIVTLPSSQRDLPTVNLRGPVVLNVRTRRGCQTVTSDDAHGMQTPVDVLSLPHRVS